MAVGSTCGSEKSDETCSLVVSVHHGLLENDCTEEGLNKQ
jgi:hypothetical protein